jgi:hypothetical protein
MVAGSSPARGANLIFRRIGRVSVSDAANGSSTKADEFAMRVDAATYRPRVALRLRG